MSKVGSWEQRLSHLALGVAEVERAALFYEALGWERASASRDQVALFNAHGMVISFSERKALASRILQREDLNRTNRSPVTSPISSSILVYVVRPEDDLRAMLDRAVANGATILSDLEEFADGSAKAFFADPDGHVWELARTVKTQVTEDGTFRIGA
ncbi:MULTISPECIES: VOC family protein [unclassified Sphingobium]|uniref:VOC family protein n=1 Tax=unclassified Sphingobium TaxID=2611147 RepID=UPI001919EC2D|nr:MULTISPECIES: VOC family protein [unclassified Sphingobium]CAD7337914.1 hypothetical protein SPHS8_01795 [Sphingobium sp. S8]CAD7339048.1 hypothetical protein SPHS6_02258 [Sphingobium sp. S6]